MTKSQFKQVVKDTYESSKLKHNLLAADKLIARPRARRAFLQEVVAKLNRKYTDALEERILGVLLALRKNAKIQKA